MERFSRPEVDRRGHVPLGDWESPGNNLRKAGEKKVQSLTRVKRNEKKLSGKRKVLGIRGRCRRGERTT